MNRTEYINIVRKRGIYGKAGAWNSIADFFGAGHKK